MREERPTKPVAMTEAQHDLLQAAAAGARIVWDIWGDGYYYRYDRHERCTVDARPLVAAGLLAQPEMGQGRECSITEAGRGALDSRSTHA